MHTFNGISIHCAYRNNQWTYNVDLTSKMVKLLGIRVWECDRKFLFYVRLFNYIYGSAYKAEKKIKCSFLPRCIIGSECFTDENKTGIRLKHNEGLKTHKTSFITAARGKIQNEEKKQSSFSILSFRTNSN